MTNILQNIRNLYKLFKIPARNRRELEGRFLLQDPPSPGTIKHKRKMCSTENSLVLVEKDENITLIGLCRENNRNSIDFATSRALKEAISRFEMDTSSLVAVLYGVGGSFSAGHDVIELEQQIEQNNFNNLFQTEGSVAPTRRHLKKPIVCAINGYCVAAGLELALLCDLRVMEDTAVLGFFNRRFGVPICDGGTARLSKCIGYGRALEMICSGRRVNAKEAFEIGLVNRIVATGTSLGQAVNLAFSISKFSQSALSHDRSRIYGNVYECKTFLECVQEETMLSKKVTTELKTGIQKFLNSKTKGAKVDSFNIKEKAVPDWEKEEIRIENEYAKCKSKSSKSF